MYHIKIEMGDGKTTHETTDVKKARKFIIDSIRNAELANFHIHSVESP